MFRKLLSRYEKHSWKAGVLILLIPFSIFIKRKIDIHYYSIETYGEIYDVDMLRVAGFNSLQYNYKFSYRGKEYFGTSTKYLDRNLGIEGLYKVKFLQDDPNVNEIFLDKKYVRKFIQTKDGKQTIIYLQKNIK